MSRLDDLYKAIETFRREGVPFPDELEQKLRTLEEEIIKKEILPVLSKTIEPALKPVKRELVLVVDYVPGQPLSVHLSRKRNFTADLQDAKEIVSDPEVSHDSYEKHKDTAAKRNPASALSVIFPDGTVIAERKAVDTLIKVVKKIGVSEVRGVVERYNITLCKVPLVSNRKDKTYGTKQKNLGNGWLLMTLSSNAQKKKIIEQLSDLLHLNLKVVINEHEKRNDIYEHQIFQ